jgi:hypothetical protein
VYVFKEFGCGAANFIRVSKQMQNMYWNGVAAREISTCPCCKMPGFKNNMVGKSMDWTSARSSSTAKPYHNRSDADTELRFCCGVKYLYVKFLLFPLLRVRLQWGSKGIPNGVDLLGARRTFGKCFIAFHLPCLTRRAYLLCLIEAGISAGCLHNVK